MSRFNLVGKTLRDSRTTIIAISVVVGAIGLMDVLIFPSYRESFRDMEVPKFVEGFLGEATDLFSPEGFLTAEFFSWIPLLLITIAIIGGTAAIAGEESAGTLDMLLAQPVRRFQVLLEKAAGLTIGIVIACAAGFLGLLAGMAFVDLELSVAHIGAAVISMIPLTLFFLGLSLWASAVMPTRGAAAMFVTGVVIITYFANLVGSSVDAIADVRDISPFYWSDFSRVLLHGFDWVRSGVLTVLALSFLGLSLWSFEQRDIAGGGREWSLRLALGRRAWRGRAAEPRQPQREVPVKV
jgi:ABC-2 type transport system permease protein